jgi:Bardet-Biedl syndrome 9 protein
LLSLLLLCVVSCRVVPCRAVLGLDVEIVATYQSANKEPRVAHHTVTVPLLLACRPRPALKTGLHKLTLSTLHPALPLSELFEDFLSSAKEYMDVGDGTSSASSLGFQLWASSEQILGVGPGSGPGAGSGSGGPSAAQQPAVVSILVSKNAGRYRVQSDSLPALLLVLSELERRLSKRIETFQSEGGMDREGAEEKEGGRAVTCDDEYPLQEYFACIRAHFELRSRLAEQLSLLNDSAHQYRMVQKRLLVRFKDRNPTPLLGLDALMRESYHSLLRTSE